jgi:hypothetical protein
VEVQVYPEHGVELIQRQPGDVDHVDPVVLSVAIIKERESGVREKERETNQTDLVSLLVHMGQPLPCPPRFASSFSRASLCVRAW